MTSFLKKINANFEYIQLLPNKPKYKRGLSPAVNGLTGEALLKEMYRRLELYGYQYNDYYAFIVEDDLDCRFHEMSEVDILDYRNRIQAEVNRLMKKEVPVIFLFASPEIESWFLVDWEHTFQKVYVNRFFTNRLRVYVDHEVVKEYWQTGIEKYGIINGVYTKLSDKIIDAILQVTIDNGIQDNSLRYSKRDHGDMMLRNAVPENLLEKCALFFAPAYRELKALG